jgi:hypothetical protein
VGNGETERRAIELVIEAERPVGRTATDVHLTGLPFDVESSPRKIEVKAFGGSARGAPIPLEERQVRGAREDPEQFYVYVVDQVVHADVGLARVRVLHSDALAAVIGRAKPVTTYWPTFRALEYDQAMQLLPG